MTDTRTQFTAALRQFADWLDANPKYPAPSTQRLLLPLHSNDAVREFADEHGLDVAADHEGNLSAQLDFGVLVYEAYGYTDFKAHLSAVDERNARQWATKNGLEIVAKAGARTAD